MDQSLRRQLVIYFQSTVDKLLKKANLSLVVGTSSWREQFIEAITVSAGTSSLQPMDHLIRMCWTSLENCQNSKKPCWPRLSFLRSPCCLPRNFRLEFFWSLDFEVPTWTVRVQYRSCYDCMCSVMKYSHNWKTLDNMLCQNNQRPGLVHLPQVHCVVKHDRWQTD